MAGLRNAVIRVGFETLYYSGAHRLARRFLAGRGAILAFHRVIPASERPFQPNRLLEIAPAFLDEVLTSIRAADIEIVDLDEAARRIASPAPEKRFVALTFDDGFRDTREVALPILAKHAAPMTMFVTPAFAEGRGELWWMILEDAIAKFPAIEVEIDGAERVFDCATPEAKQAAFDALCAYIRSRPAWSDGMRTVREIAFGYGIDPGRQCRSLCMDWDEIAEMAKHPLVTIGAHTATHPVLSRLTDGEARTEMTAGVDAIAANLGERPAHFSYPVGGPDAAGPREFAAAAAAGFRTAVTTRPGVLHAAHAGHMTALPRLSVNGDFQRLRYLDVLLSGAPTALMNGFRRVDAA